MFSSFLSSQDPNSEDNQPPREDSENSTQRDDQSKSPKEPERKANWPMLVLLGVAVALIISAFFIGERGKNIERLSTLPQLEQRLQGEGEAQKIDRNSIVLFTKQDGTELILGDYEAPPEEQSKDKNASFYRGFELSYHQSVQRDKVIALLDQYEINPSSKIEPNNMWGAFIMTFLPLLLIAGLLIFFFTRQMKAAGRGAMNFGKSKAKMLQQDKKKVTFKDVAGVQEAKDEVTEIVDFLRDPSKFQKLGGNIPKGVLMVGPPGTGKTLLARSIAGEADVPFFSISGSDFVEMFVGVGASRVRDMFEQARAQSPCLVFIDEIDAVGRHRGHGLGGGHDEREQTLNQLLVEMDGFDAQEGVIIIAATNRPDVLDPALLRPGRFDRQVTVSLPDVKGREQILQVHARKVKLAEDVDLSKVARGTPGYSGAELANVLNEAALLAARKGLEEIGQAELEEARDKVRWGRERRSLALSDKEKRVTAVHEAGHAIPLEILEHTEPLHKVTIIPRGPSLGSTMWLPEEDKYNTRRNELLDNLVVAMGGRVAEEIVFGDVTSGAAGDIQQATNIARKMVCSWGMSENLGMVEYGEGQGEVFLARDIGSQRNYSEDTAQKIDHEVRGLIDDAYQKAHDILTQHRDKLDALTEALLEHETLDGNHVKEIMAHGHLINPPKPPEPPTPPASPSVETPHNEQAKEKKDQDDLPPEVVGSPA